MKGGNKGEPPSTKLVRGTWRADRDAQRVEIIAPDDPPALSESVAAEVEAFWQEALPRVMASGVTELDSELFLNYCQLSVAIRKSWRKGKAPPGSHLTEARRLAELLGIAGPKSRVGRAPPESAPEDDPFGDIR